LQGKLIVVGVAEVSLHKRFIELGEGQLACGYIGKGRLAEPEEILAAIEQHFITICK
jgi:phosphopantothenoylcysteine synthetase/decarboxylase